MKAIIFSALSLFAATSFAQSYTYASQGNPDVTVTEKTLSFEDYSKKYELFLLSGMESHHLQNADNLNAHNSGVGLELQWDHGKYGVMVGEYKNSNWKHSNYASFQYLPFSKETSYGNFRLGVVAGVVNGYPGVNDGKIIPLVLPLATYEYKRFGVNLTYVPPIKDKIYSSVSIQFKYKLMSF